MKSVWISVFALFTNALNYNFIQLTDLHWDPLYSDSKNSNQFCHYSPFPKNSFVNPYFGNVATECDSPTALINQTFNYLNSIQSKYTIDAVFWTGDSPRHDRDASVRRTVDEIWTASQHSVNRMLQTFRPSTVILPSIGNWDTEEISFSSPGDLIQLFEIWKPLWSTELQNQFKDSFLQGGYYIYNDPKSSLSVISLNTLAWYNENYNLSDCDLKNKNSKHPGNIQFQWLKEMLKTIRKSNRKVILIGHVPPITHAEIEIYKLNCYDKYINLVGKYSDIIVTQYYGHVNRDMMYAITKSKSDFSIIPFSKKILKKDVGSIQKQSMIGHFFTGPSIVPYYNPGFRLGSLNITQNEIELIGHIQYYADLERLNKDHKVDPDDTNQPKNSTFYNPTCSTIDSFQMRKLNINGIRSFLSRIQTELSTPNLKNKPKSTLLDSYGDCIKVQYQPANGVEHLKLDQWVIYTIVFAITVIFSVGIWIAIKGFRSSTQYEQLSEQA
ncbi:Metallo-dependent phosphatase-like protein [Globomyces pollinis-pini]|nr:Metallo-dependent phosphatase-like protein [Globomyces pollinis-pini]